MIDKYVETKQIHLIPEAYDILDTLNDLFRVKLFIMAFYL